MPLCRKSRSMFEYAKKRVWEGRHFPGEEEKRGEDGTLIFTSIVEHFTKSMYYETKSKKKKKITNELLLLKKDSQFLPALLGSLGDRGLQKESGPWIPLVWLGEDGLPAALWLHRRLAGRAPPVETHGCSQVCRAEAKSSPAHSSPLFPKGHRAEWT